MDYYSWSYVRLNLVIHNHKISSWESFSIKSLKYIYSVRNLAKEGGLKIILQILVQFFYHIKNKKVTPIFRKSISAGCFKTIYCWKIPIIDTAANCITLKISLWNRYLNVDLHTNRGLGPLTSENVRCSFNSGWRMQPVPTYILMHWI